MSRLKSGVSILLVINSTHPASATEMSWLFDMHGNVEEWCHDWYGPFLPELAVDPIGYETGEFRVTRGGSHDTPVYALRSANRQGALPETRQWLIGFRVVIGELPLAVRCLNLSLPSISET